MQGRLSANAAPQHRSTGRGGEAKQPAKRGGRAIVSALGSTRADRRATGGDARRAPVRPRPTRHNGPASASTASRQGALGRWDRRPPGAIGGRRYGGNWGGGGGACLLPKGTPPRRVPFPHPQRPFLSIAKIAEP